MDTAESGGQIQDQSAPVRGTQREQRCVASLRQAMKNGDSKAEVYSLKDLGDVHLDKGKVRRHGWDFTRASALYNAALVRCKESQVRETLIHRVKYTEKLFLKRVAKVNKHDAVMYDYQTDLNHKAELTRIRDMCRERLITIATMCDYSENPMEDVAAREGGRAEAVRELYRDITREMKAFITSLVEECFSVVERPPCKYAMIGMGSFARQEMTPYSDLEFAILVEEGKGTGENKTYFRILTHLLHLKVLNLGETILPSMAIPYLNDFENKEHNWLYDSVTPRGFSFDGAMPWASKTPLGRGETKRKIALELIMTPRQMAELQTEERSVKEGYHLASVLSKVDLITGDGDILAIYDELVLKKLDKELSNSSQITVGRDRAMANLLTIMANFQLDKIVPIQGELYDVKQVIYRFLSMCFRHIGDLCGTGGKILIDTIEELQKGGILTFFAAHNVRVAAAIADEIRLRTYCTYGKQREHMAIFKALRTKRATQTTEYSSTLENGCTETKPGTNQHKDVVNSATETSVSPHHVYHIDDSNLLHRFYMTVLPLQFLLHDKLLLSVREFDIRGDGHVQLMREVFTSQSLYGGALERGMAFRILQQDAQAEECLRNALQKDPNNDDVAIALAVALAKLGNYNDVQQLLHPVRDRIVQSLENDTHSYSDVSAKIGRYRIVQKILSAAREDEDGNTGQWSLRNSLAQASASNMSKLDKAELYSVIACSFVKSGDRDQSELYLQKARENLNLDLNTGDKISMQHKLKRADTLADIANTHEELESAPELVIKYAQLAREAYIECVGADTPHIRLMKCMVILCAANKRLGDWNKVVECFEQIAEMASALAETQPYTFTVISSLLEMGNAYLQLGEVGKGLELLQQAEGLLPDSWDDRHAPVAMATIHVYGIELEKVGRVEEARERFQRILDLLVRGEKHELIMMIKVGSSAYLGEMSLKSGQINIAIEYKMQSFSLYAHVFRNDLGNVKALKQAMYTTCQKGLLELQLLKFGAALQSFSAALELLDSTDIDIRHVFPNESESIMSCRLLALTSKAYCLFRLSDLQRATPVYNEAVNTFRDFYGTDAHHPVLACCLTAKGRLHDTQGDSEIAKKCYSEVWEMIIKGQAAGQSGYESILPALFSFSILSALVSFSILPALFSFCATMDEPNSPSGMAATAKHLLEMIIQQKSFLLERKPYG